MTLKAKMSSTVPRYKQIAIAIASRIANGEYIVGQRISGRSSIAGQYNVSPETARRAFCILADWDIVSAEQGSGMLVRSKENAASYIRQYADQKNIESIKEDIYQSIQHQRQELQQLNEQLNELLAATEHYHHMNPLLPQNLRLTERCRFLGRTIQEIRLWHNTGATLIAIKRDGQFLISPGPDVVLREHDLLYFITSEMSDRGVRDYLCEEAE